MTTTTNLGLRLPELTDAASITDINYNSGKIDAALGKAGAVVDLIYPVGSIYMSVVNTSPATLFGGTWSQLEGKFLLGSDSSHAAGTTGGAASASYTPAGSNAGTAITVNQMPSHDHTFTGTAKATASGGAAHTHSIGAHKHGLGSHTHTLNDHTHTISNHTHSLNSHTHGLGSHTHSVSAHTHGLNSHTHGLNSHVHTLNSHTHTMNHSHTPGPDATFFISEDISGSSDWCVLAVGTSGLTNKTIASYSGNTGAASGNTGAASGSTAAASGNTASGGSGTTGEASGNTGAASGNTGSGGSGSTGAASGNTGAASGNTANSSAFDSGSTTASHTHNFTAEGSIGSKGGGATHTHTFSGTAATINTMPPYLSVYMWKRTA